jgi:spore maturation protein CgeB
MNKCILFVQYHLFMPDVGKVLADQGYTLVGLQPNGLSMERFNAACDAHHPQWLFSINFSPEIAYLCSSRGLPYVSWTIDPLPSKRLELIGETNTASCVAFAHDMQTVHHLAGQGIRASHLLLAAPANRRSPIRDSASLAPYQCDVSFVGSSMIDEMSMLDRWLVVRGGDMLSAAALDWVNRLLQLVASDRSFCGLHTVGGVDALPDFLKDICRSTAEQDELISLLDGVLSALYRQRGVAIMDRFHGASALWGDPGWTDIHHHYRGGADHGEELTMIYCASGINLDIPRLYQRQTITMRIFDILASGGFVLAERSAALEAVFEQDRHLAYYDSHEELNDVLARWKSAPLAREAIAKAGRQEVLDKHQIKHRVEKMLIEYLGAGFSNNPQEN